MITPIASGVKDLADDGTSWINWWVFSPKSIDEDVYAWLDSNNVGYWYSGPGRAFSNRPSVRRTGGRVLVTQLCGLDV